MLAVSDNHLIGKCLEGDIAFHVSEEFYHENMCDDAKIKRLLKSATIINAVGNDIVSLLIKENIINSENVIKIAGVPHAQVISIK